MSEENYAMGRLYNSLKESNAKVTFGIQERHLKIIASEIKHWEKSGHNINNEHPQWMLYCEDFWQDIGKKIGWSSFTIALYYFDYVRELNIKKNVDIKFINKRIIEQSLYLETLDITTERGKLMYDSAKSQLDYFLSLKQNYNGL